MTQQFVRCVAVVWLSLATSVGAQDAPPGSRYIDPAIGLTVSDLITAAL